LQGIEKTLRDTLSKLGKPDEGTRLKLYKATENILARSLAPYAESQPDMVAARNAQLHEIIAKLEDEYKTAVVQPTPDVSAASSTQTQTHTKAYKPDPAPIIAPVQPVETPRLDTNDIKAQTEPNLAAVSPPVSVDQTDVRAPDIRPVEHEASRSEQWPDATVQPVQRASQNTSAPEIDLGLSTRKSAPHNTTTPQVDHVVASPTAVPAPKAEPVALAKDEQISQQDRSIASQEKRQAKKGKRKRRGRILERIAGLIVYVIILVFLIGGAWLFVESDYYQLFDDWRTGKNDIKTAEVQAVTDDNFVPKSLNSSAEGFDDWVVVFGAGDAGKVRGRGEVLVEQIGNNVNGGVRITSVNSGEFGEALVPLNGQILQSAASQKFALSMSVSVDKPTEIYVRCLLKGGVEISRRRFKLDGGQNNILVDLDMTQVPQFENQPYLAINSDITGGGSSVELYDVRYQVTDR
jgi:hypothetical protein